MENLRKKFNFSKDTTILIVSIIFAIFLWSYVRSVVDPQRTKIIKQVPVRLENVAEIKGNNLSIISNDEIYTDITIKGKSSQVSKVTKNNISASINLSGYYSGNNKIPIKAQVNINNVTVDKIEPEVAFINIDENIERDAHVDIKLIGSLSDGFVLGNLKQKEYISVSGPKSYLDSIETIEAVVDISDKSETTVISSVPVAYDKEGNIINDISFEPSSLDVEVPILKTLTVPVKLNVVGSAGDDTHSFNVEPNSITIKGNSAVINKITELSTKPVGSSELLNTPVPVELNLPDGVSLVDKDIKFVASSTPITLPEQEINFNKDEIKLEGIKNELNYTVDLDEDIILKLTPKDPLNKEKLNKHELTLSVDLSSLKEGEHRVKLNITKPNEFKLVDINPKSIKISIKKKGLFN